MSIASLGDPGSRRQSAWPGDGDPPAEDPPGKTRHVHDFAVVLAVSELFSILRGCSGCGATRVSR